MHAPPRRCFWLGFWFGFGLFGAGVSWVYVSLHTSAPCPRRSPASPPWGSAPFSRSSRRPPGWLQARVPAPDAVRACLLIPAAWVLTEWTRGWIFTGFPWLAVGYPRSAGRCRATRRSAASTCFLSPPSRSPDCSGCWCTAAAQGGVHPRSRSRCSGVGQALQTVRWTAPSGEPVTAALLQGNIAQEMKFSPQRYPAHLRNLRPARGRQRARSSSCFPRPRCRVLPPRRRARSSRASRPRRAATAATCCSGVPDRARRGLLQQRDLARACRLRRSTARRISCRSANSSRPASAGCSRSCASRCPISPAARRTSRRSTSPASASRSTSATRTCSARRSRRELPTRRCSST